MARQRKIAQLEIRELLTVLRTERGINSALGPGAYSTPKRGVGAEVERPRRMLPLVVKKSGISINLNSRLFQNPAAK
jgi:hypothetical protein